MSDTAKARFEMASRLAADIAAKAEELSTAIYEASKYGYSAAVVVRNAVPITKGNGEIRCVGGERSVVIKATIAFDIGDRGL